MKIYIYIFIIPLIGFNICCSSLKSTYENQKLINCLNSKKFKQFYALCRKKDDTIFVYNNLNDFNNFPLLKVECNKNIKVIKSKIKVDINSSGLIRENKIIIYKYELMKNKSKLFFINGETNGYLNFILDKKNEIVNIESGVY